MELIIIATLTALSYIFSLWFARRFGSNPGRETPAPGAESGPRLRRQAGYFATTTAIVVFAFSALAWLLARFCADQFVVTLMHQRLTHALAHNGDMSPPAALINALTDKARNRAAFPELYDDQPASVVLQNAANWYVSVQNSVDIVVWVFILVAASLALAWSLSRFGRAGVSPQQAYERLSQRILLAISSIAVLCSVGIVASLLTESVLFFTHISVFDFLFGLHWNPQIAIRSDQVAAQGAFGFIPLLTGTVLISAIAIAVAFPAGVMIAVYTSEYASSRQRNLIKPTLEMLAGIPTVVYGAFAAIYVGPWLRDVLSSLGIDATVESALAVGAIMGIMIIPLVSSLIDDALHQIPNSIREAMFALGATRAELVRMILLPASLPGIVGALLLAISRAFGETMIVVMAAGLAARLTINPLEAVTTVTVQIATILVGDQSFDSVKTLSAFALGLALFLITLSLNVLASWVTNRFKVVYQ